MFDDKQPLAACKPGRGGEQPPSRSLLWEERGSGADMMHDARTEQSHTCKLAPIAGKESRLGDDPVRTIPVALLRLWSDFRSCVRGC